MTDGTGTVDLTVVEGNIKKMQEQGATKDEMNAYLDSIQTAYRNPQGEITNPPPKEGEFLLTDKQATIESIRGALAKYVRPTAEVGASVGAQAIVPTAKVTAGTGGATTPLLAAVALGALGFSAAKTGLDWIDRKLISIAYDKEQEPQGDTSFIDGVITGLENFRQGLMWELMGRNIGNVVGRFANALTKKPKTPMEELAEELNQRLTRAERSQKRSTQLIEAVLDKAPASADVMADFRFQNQLKPLMEERSRLLSQETTSETELRNVGFRIYSQINKYLTEVEHLKGTQLESVRANILAELGGDFSYSSIGVTGKEALIIANKAARLRATELYNKVGENFEFGQNVPTPELSKTSEKLLAERLKLPAQESAFVKRLRWASTTTADEEERVIALLKEQYPNMSDDVLTGIADKLDELAPPDPSQIKDWQTLVAFDQELRSLIDAGDSLKNVSGISELDNIRRMYIEMQQALATDMENYANSIGGEAWTNYQIAKSFYQEEVGEIFRTDTIRQLFKTNPEDVIDAAFKPNGITELRLLRKALKADPTIVTEEAQQLLIKNAEDQLQQGFVNRLLGVGTGEAFDPKLLKRNLNKYGEEFLVETLGAANYGSLRRAVDSGTHILLSEPIGDKYLRSLVKPDTIDLSFIVDNIIGATERPTASRYLAPNLTLLRNILQPEEFQKLSEIYLERVFAPEAATGLIDPVKLSNTLRQNERVLRLWYSPEKYNRLMRLAELGTRQQTASRLARGIGDKETLATWTTGMMSIRAATSRSITGRVVAPIVSFGPRMLAKLYLSENGLRFLEEATTIPLTSEKSAELATKILTILYGTPYGTQIGGIEGAVPELKRERVKRQYQKTQ